MEVDMYELKEETKELIERIRRLDINAPMCCALLDLAAAQIGRAHV